MAEETKLAVGAIVKAYGAVGIVKDIFISPSTDKTIFLFYGPKNAFKGQAGDFIPVGEGTRIEGATEDDLKAEVELYFEFAQASIFENLGEKYAKVPEPN